jgi:signal recognition particle subunit SRP72
VYVLVDLSRTKDALDLIQSKPDYIERFPFEYAYCLYKEGQVQDALDQLSKVPEDRALDRKRLEGQLRYRLEQYDQCIEVYKEIFRAPFHENSIEAKANIVAAHVAAGRSDEIPALLADIGCSATEGLEVAFNVACGLINSGHYQESKEQLEMTQRIGQETLFDEGLDDDEVAEELAVVDAQLAYVSAIGHDTLKALHMFESVLDLDSPDEVANVVAAANVVLCHIACSTRDRKGTQEQMKKLEPFMERSGGLLKVKSSLEGRLGKSACQGILGAYACGSLAANKTDHAREAARSLETLHPESPMGALIQSSIMAREGKTKEAISLVQSNAGRFSRSDIELGALSMGAHLAAHAKQYTLSAEIMSKLPQKVASAPAVVATQSSLYEMGGNVDQAVHTALAAVEGDDVDGKKWALKKLVDMKLLEGDLQTATEYLIRLSKVDGTVWEDPWLLNLLPRCIACSNPAMQIHAEGMDGDIFASIDVDVDALEARAGAALTQSKRQQEERPSDAGKREKKTRKKRKIVYPKGFDPDHPEKTPLPDPERWLPKWQRAENRKLRKKNKGKAGPTGSQGAGKVDTSLDFSQAKPQTARAKSSQGKGKGKKGRR